MPCCIPLSLGGTRRIAVYQTKKFSFYISFASLVGLDARRRSSESGPARGGASAQSCVSVGDDISPTQSQLRGLHAEPKPDQPRALASMSKGEQCHSYYSLPDPPFRTHYLHMRLHVALKWSNAVTAIRRALVLLPHASSFSMVLQ